RPHRCFELPAYLLSGISGPKFSIAASSVSAYLLIHASRHMYDGVNTSSKGRRRFEMPRSSNNTAMNGVAEPTTEEGTSATRLRSNVATFDDCLARVRTIQDRIGLNTHAILTSRDDLARQGQQLLAVDNVPDTGF